jgi:hypothetical protein
MINKNTPLKDRSYLVIKVQGNIQFQTADKIIITNLFKKISGIISPSILNKRRIFSAIARWSFPPV